MLELGDHVTWSARHLGWRWRVTSKITAFDRPRHFRDSMVSGVFTRFDHDHHFEARGGATVVRDVFDFTSPWGPLGRLADLLLVTRHMRGFLGQRMRELKQLAESDAWMMYLPVVPPAAASDDHTRWGGGPTPDVKLPEEVSANVPAAKAVLMERPCALVHEPRKGLVTYHGVLAPASGLRARMVPHRVEKAGKAGGCRHGAGGDGEGEHAAVVAVAEAVE